MNMIKKRTFIGSRSGEYNSLTAEIKDLLEIIKEIPAEEWSADGGSGCEDSGGWSSSIGASIVKSEVKYYFSILISLSRQAARNADVFELRGGCKLENLHFTLSDAEERDFYEMNIWGAEEFLATCKNLPRNWQSCVVDFFDESIFKERRGEGWV